VEQLPPTFHILARLCVKLFGVNPWALRLPEILGVGVMSLCLFIVVSRRSSAAYGLVAMLLPLVTHAFYYATEARPYGLVLGCAALSFLCWQSAADERRRVLSLVGLAVSLAAALASHYYAVFIFVPLAAGEIARTVVRRRLDPSMWLAFALATLPLWAFLPLIQAGRRLGATFWARPRWFDTVTFYQSLLGLTASGGIFLFIGILVLLTTYALARSSIGAEPKHGATSRIPVPEVVAALGYLAIPALGVLLAKVATGAFTDRYALAAVVGLALIIPWGAYLILDGRATLGIALAAVLFFWFVAKDGIEPAMTQRRELATLQDTLAFLRRAAPDDAPLVIASPHIFFQLSYYAPPPLASRLVYLTDTAASMRYFKTDTVELGLQEFRRWAPMSVEDYRSYVRAHPRFLLYGDTGAWVWLLPELMATGARLQLVAVKGSLRLFLVDTAAESSDRAGARPGKADP
jgi:4-amino-4-deoxy-L-arabinose transferase-like glycosyltransferase